MSVSTTAILEQLLRAGAISDAQFADFKSAPGGSVEKQLAAAGIDEDSLLHAKAAALGVAAVDLRAADVPPSVLTIIPREVSAANKAIAYALHGSELRVGFVDPGNTAAVKAVEFLTEERNYALAVALISEASFAAAQRGYDIAESEVEKALVAAEKKFSPREKEAAGEVGEIIKGAPVSRVVSIIFSDAVRRGASDIHVEPFEEESRVRYRLDGVLHTVLKLPGYIHDSVIARIKVLAKLKLDETRVPQDGRIGQTIAGRKIDLRVSTLPVGEQEKAAIRVLDTSVGVPTLEMLGFRSEHISIIKEEIKKPHGLFLISGPTGSGKSTTLYTILNMLNAEGSNIVTLEDPIEYYIKGVNQSQVRPEVGYTFAAGLRSVLRQDPNVIMVGEIRDEETAILAVHAALTGHLMFSTIHTNDAIGVLPRLADLGVEPFLLAATFNVATAQRLARKLCDSCRASAPVGAAAEAMARRELTALPPAALPPGVDSRGPLNFFRGAGCASCANTGYAGRVAIAEIFRMTPELSRLLSEQMKPQALRDEAARQGMITLRQDGILKALAGLTTLEEVERVSKE